MATHWLACLNRIPDYTPVVTLAFTQFHIHIEKKSYFFSDSFDCDNGLQCKGKNSVIGLYIQLLNLSEHNRSSRDGILSVQFMKNSQVKNFQINACLKQFVEDLNDLIENGLILPNGGKAHVRLVQYR